ncbi:ribonuclease HI [Neorhizobium sp. T786]|uniref:ribonuclease H family protein n=1 Tax=Pseudorhizobium xiangyangii TaxID=2883104 RepID=UPI001CFF5B01|nr:ribonuclease H [Neorhizobium xiangyangii]MCB5205440.1 ribonuclease HI [Neorhizobium xiangyangii]
MLSPASPLEIFTDGSFWATKHAGGWAFVVQHGNRRIHVQHGRGVGNSNNSFELMSVIEAMNWLARTGEGYKAIIWTDSAHVVEGCHHWRAIWRNNGWKRVTADQRVRKRSIPDAELWKRLDELLNRHPEVAVSWCKGHSGLIGNNLADALARTAVDTRGGGFRFP